MDLLNQPCARCTHTKATHALAIGCVVCWCEEFCEGEATLSGDEVIDLINHPPHYTNNPSGVECIDITMHMNFCIGNAVKYLWRVDDKGDPLENLEKAKWYIECEIKRREDKK